DGPSLRAGRLSRLAAPERQAMNPCEASILRDLECEASGAPVQGGGDDAVNARLRRLINQTRVEVSSAVVVLSKWSEVAILKSQKGVEGISVINIIAIVGDR